MKHDAHMKPAKVSKTADIPMVWGVPGPGFEDAEKMYRAWLDGAQRMQGEAVAFFNERVGKDMAMLSDCARCATAAEALEVQARYGSDAIADYVAEGQRMFELMGGAARGH